MQLARSGCFSWLTSASDSKMMLHNCPSSKVNQQVEADSEDPSRDDIATSAPSRNREELEDNEELEYQKYWDLLFSEFLGDPRRQDKKANSEEDSEMPPVQLTSRPTREEQQQAGVAVVAARRVRHYRKWVNVRLGNLDWSFALFLVVKSRSTVSECKDNTVTRPAALSLRSVSPT